MHVKHLEGFVRNFLLCLRLCNSSLGQKGTGNREVVRRHRAEETDSEKYMYYPNRRLVTGFKDFRPLDDNAPAHASAISPNVLRKEKVSDHHIFQLSLHATLISFQN